MRYLKNGPAKAIRTLRAAAADAAPTDRVIGLSPLQIQRRFTAAARAAGIEARVTAHSGRVGLASELTARGASTTEVMLAGNWKTARMVAHYSAGATAERGAVRKYLCRGLLEAGGRHRSKPASIEPHSGMNSRCRVTGSRTSKPHQNHSTQEKGAAARPCARGGEPGVDRGWPRCALDASRGCSSRGGQRRMSGSRAASGVPGAWSTTGIAASSGRGTTRPAPPRCTTGTPPGTPTTRRTQCGRIARVPIADGRSALAMAGAAVRRVDEQRTWQTVRARRDDERAPS